MTNGLYRPKVVEAKRKRQKLRVRDLLDEEDFEDRAEYLQDKKAQER